MEARIGFRVSWGSEAGAELLLNLPKCQTREIWNACGGLYKDLCKQSGRQFARTSVDTVRRTSRMPNSHDKIC